MASTVDVTQVTTSNTFDHWRIQTNLGINDVNEIARGNFTKPTGNVILTLGYLELANTSGQTLRVLADARVSGKLSIKNYEQDGGSSYFYSGAGDVQFQNAAGQLQVTGNTRTRTLWCNTISHLANVNANGYIETVGTHSNNGMILNVANFLTVANTIRFGNVNISSNVVITQRANISGTVNVGSILSVASGANTILSGNLAVSRNVAFSQNANVTGTLNVGSILSVASGANTILSGNLIISRNVSATQNVNVSGTLNVTSAVFLSNTITYQTEYFQEVTSITNIGAAGAGIKIYSFPKASWSSGKLMVQIKSADVSFPTGATQISEMVLAHNTTAAYVTVYGTISSPPASEGSSLLGTFSSQVNGADVELLFNSNYSSSAVKVVANLIR